MPEALRLYNFIHNNKETPSHSNLMKFFMQIGQKVFFHSFQDFYPFITRMTILYVRMSYIMGQGQVK
ncbi:hypothetical protein BK126_05520 [Paenibacillus sp. FSL H7-0326]|nr:hypothetical protein BK126_05520 [Paenibacillus sp. FSL H7-0326]